MAKKSSNVPSFQSICFRLQTVVIESRKIEEVPLQYFQKHLKDAYHEKFVHVVEIMIRYTAKYSSLSSKEN